MISTKEEAVDRTVLDRLRTLSARSTPSFPQLVLLLLGLLLLSRLLGTLLPRLSSVLLKLNRAPLSRVATLLSLLLTSSLKITMLLRFDSFVIGPSSLAQIINRSGFLSIGSCRGWSSIFSFVCGSSVFDGSSADVGFSSWGSPCSCFSS